MTATPMMQQYEDAKRASPGALLLFRMGDFYELFYEDAEVAAKTLGLTLTTRDKNRPNPVPMAGFPHHQLESYLAKLVAAGLRAAICDQVEDPKQAKGIVRREITRIVSAGTLTDDAMLDPRRSNYLAAVLPGDPTGLSWIDLSTGRFLAARVPADALGDELARIGPVECLMSEEAADPPAVSELQMTLTRRRPWAFSADAAQSALTKQFGTHSLEGFGFSDEDSPALAAAGAILDYLQETQRCGLDHIDRLLRYQRGQTLEIDESTRRSLELTRTLRTDDPAGSLLGVIDRTVTSMGSRRLGEWMAAPLVSVDEIERRLAAVDEFANESSLRNPLRDSLEKTYDVERLLARVATGRASPRDLSFLGRTLAELPSIKAKLSARSSELVADLESRLDLCADVRAAIEQTLIDDCPLSNRDGGFIRAGFHDELDQLRELARGGKEWIAQYQAREAERTEIPSLKIGFNRVFGYYLEVSNAHREKVPDDYHRKQTLKNAERYITPELKEYEERVVGADEKSQQLEYELFVALRERVAAEGRRLRETASILADLDALSGLAEIAVKRNYVRPQVVADPVVHVDAGRHPVLDVIMSAGELVPNDCDIEEQERRLLLVTGPNMAGKSTYIRQVALLTVLAQIGSFVPAKKATIGVADRIFARIGASDELSRGQSTFMVEMTETARILNLATRRSLVILDEIGRGTSTYDGMSLAWAVMEALHDTIGCRTLFATHYHELTSLADELPAIANLNVAVREWNDEVMFLHRIVEGAADKSYGIHVARLAGVPAEVVDRAKAILADLEEEHVAGSARTGLGRRRRADLQLSLFATAEHPLLDTIRETEVEQMTPLDALAKIQAWKEELADNKAPNPK